MFILIGTICSAFMLFVGVAWPDLKLKENGNFL